MGRKFFYYGFFVLLGGYVSSSYHNVQYIYEVESLKQRIEQTKQCLRNSQYEEWELCYE